MNQGFDYWFGLPHSHDMRMTAPREKAAAERRLLRSESPSTGTSR